MNRIKNDFNKNFELKKISLKLLNNVYKNKLKIY
jgi:hypothetical protein